MLVWNIIYSFILSRNKNISISHTHCKHYTCHFVAQDPKIKYHVFLIHWQLCAPPDGQVG